MKIQSFQRIENRLKWRVKAIFNRDIREFDRFHFLSSFDNEPVNFELIAVTILPSTVSSCANNGTHRPGKPASRTSSASTNSKVRRYLSRDSGTSNSACSLAFNGCNSEVSTKSANMAWRRVDKKVMRSRASGTVDALFQIASGHGSRELGITSQVDRDVLPATVAVDLPPGRGADGEDRSGKSLITIMNNFRSSNL